MQKFIFPIVIGVLALGGLGYFIYSDLNLGMGTAGKDEATTTLDGGGMIVTDENGNKALVELEKVPQGQNALPPAPSLDRPFTAPQNAPQLAGEYADLVATLKKNPGTPGNWVMLGTYRKNAGDYAGAAEAWQYATALSPRDYVPLSNLGDLYDSYLKEYAKAESYYLKAVSVKPDLIGVYRTLSSLYQYRYQTNTTKAADILKQGLVKNPGNVDLLISLGLYYKETGNTAEAKNYLLQAKTAAEKANDSALMARIDAELAEL